MKNKRRLKREKEEIKMEERKRGKRGMETNAVKNHGIKRDREKRKRRNKD